MMNIISFIVSLGCEAALVLHMILCLIANTEFGKDILRWLNWHRAITSTVQIMAPIGVICLIF